MYFLCFSKTHSFSSVRGKLDSITRLETRAVVLRVLFSDMYEMKLSQNLKTFCNTYSDKFIACFAICILINIDFFIFLEFKYH